MTDYAQLEAAISIWARSQPDVLALIVVGSRARQFPPVDELSDLDLIAYTTRPSRFTASSDWLQMFGLLWVAALDKTGRGDPEWLAIYDGGLKVDILLVDVATLAGEKLAEWLQHPDFQGVFWRGVRPLFERSEAEKMKTLPEIQLSPPLPPDEAEFNSLVSLFLMQAARTAKFLRRGDLWRARHECDDVLNAHLLTMLEWHARAKSGSYTNTWYDGRFLEQWADPQATQALPNCFGGYDAGRLWSALENTLELFYRLGVEIASLLNFTYPEDAHKHIIGWIRKTSNPAVP